MMMTIFKVLLGTAVAIIVFGIFPNRLKGAVIAIGTCIVLALILHFVAP
jgi:hypothetical protein